MLSQPLGLCFRQARAAEYVLTYEPAPLHELFDSVEFFRGNTIPAPLGKLTRQRDNKAQPILEVHSLGMIKQPACCSATSVTTIARTRGRSAGSSRLIPPPGRPR